MPIYCTCGANCAKIFVLFHLAMRILVVGVLVVKNEFQHSENEVDTAHQFAVRNLYPKNPEMI